MNQVKIKEEMKIRWWDTLYAVLSARIKKLLKF